MNAEQKILRLPAVLRTTGLSRTTVWRLVKANKFPAPVRLSARAIGWRHSEIEGWLRSRPAA